MNWTQLNTNNTYPLNVVYFATPDTGYAVGGERFEKGVVLQTSDGGQSWTSSTVGIKAFYCVAFLKGQTGFVAGYDGFIYRTPDKGATWQQFHSDADWGKIYHHIGFMDDTTGFIAGGSGYVNGYILKTTDGGNSWTQQDFNRELRSIVFTSGNIGFAAGYGVIYKTTDKGQNWQPTEAKGDFFMDMDFPSANTGYAVGYEGTILKTTDGGNSWKKLRNGNNVFLKNMQFESVDFINENTGYVVGRKGVMLKTDDGGDNWKIVSVNSSENLKSVFLLNSTTGFVSTESGNIYRFTD